MSLVNNNNSNNSNKRKHLEPDSDSKIKSALECTICFTIPRAAVYMCSASHSLCDVCYQKIKKAKPQCPTCKQTLSDSGRNHVAEKIIAALVFSCDNADCTFRGTLEALAIHQSQTCEYKRVSCRYCFRGCKERSYRNKIREHEQDCKFFLAKQDPEKAEENFNKLYNTACRLKNYTKTLLCDKWSFENSIIARKCFPNTRLFEPLALGYKMGADSENTSTSFGFHISIPIPNVLAVGFLALELSFSLTESTKTLKVYSKYNCVNWNKGITVDSVHYYNLFNNRISFEFIFDNYFKISTNDVQFSSDHTTNTASNGYVLLPPLTFNITSPILDLSYENFMKDLKSEKGINLTIMASLSSQSN